MQEVQKSMKPWTKEKEQKPNTTTQSRRFLTKNSLKSKIDLSKSSKCRLFLSRQMHHIKQWGHSHPNSSIPMPPKLSLPASQQLHHCFRHNPMNAKQSKHHRPQIKSKRTMDKEVVYWFPISFTHSTPIQNQNLPFTHTTPISKLSCYEII